MRGIELEEKVTELAETDVLYFICKDRAFADTVTGNRYPEAEGFTLSLEFPKGQIEASLAEVSISPYRSNDNGIEDYDWNDISLPLDEIKSLIELADKK